MECIYLVIPFVEFIYLIILAGQVRVTVCDSALRCGVRMTSL